MDKSTSQQQALQSSDADFYYTIGD